MSIRSLISVITFVLVGLVIYFTRHEIAHAWMLLGQVNLWVLALVAVTTIVGYLANGEMIFSYLRQKGEIKDVSPFVLMRMSLEMNFVNHALPSGGVSGISYMTWRLGRYGVTAGKATMAQMMRYVIGFAAFITLLVISVLAVTIDGNVNRWIIMISSTLVTVMVASSAILLYLVKSPSRSRKFADWLTHAVNRIVRKATRGKKRIVLHEDKLVAFFEDMHDDYRTLSKDKRVLWKPYLWGVLFTITEIMLFFIAFWALGVIVNPAPILIAYGVASLAGFIVVTPGGAGAYEAIMVFVLAIAGISQGTAIAGILLARVIMLLVTIGVGYLFYQHAILKYGKNDKPDTNI